MDNRCLGGEVMKGDARRGRRDNSLPTLDGNEYDPGPLNFCSLELSHHQEKLLGKKWRYTLVATVIFADQEIQTKYGPVRVGVKKANLRLDFEQSKLKLSDAGYRRQMTSKQESQIHEELEIEHTTRLSGRIGLNANLSRPNFQATAGAGAEKEQRAVLGEKTNTYLPSLNTGSPSRTGC